MLSAADAKEVMADCANEAVLKYPFQVASLALQTKSLEAGSPTQVWHQVVSQKMKSDGFLSLWSQNLIKLAYFLPCSFVTKISQNFEKQKPKTEESDPKRLSGQTAISAVLLGLAQPVDFAWQSMIL